MEKYCRDVEVFFFVNDFQNQLPHIMRICGWNNSKLAYLMGMSISSVNNYLGNASKTNEKRSSMSEAQFITLLMYIQKKVVEQNFLSVAFAAFSYLCPGISEINEDKLVLLAQNEENEISKEMICSMYASWFPASMRNLNTFVDWQCNGKEKSLREYKGVNHLRDLNDKTPLTNEEIKLAEKNAKKIIPLYLKMFMSDKRV